MVGKGIPSGVDFMDKFKDRLFDILRKMPDDTFLKFLEAPNLLDPPRKGKDLDVILPRTYMLALTF